jgi:5'-3' exonuclease
MMNKKPYIKMNTTLLIDGNWLLLSRVFLLQDKFKLTNPQRVKEEASQALMEILSRSVAGMLHKIPEITNIILIADGGSWRKELPIPDQLKETTYKGNRVKESETDWNAIFGAFTRWQNAVTEASVTVSQGYGIEGDDWVWYWSRNLNAQGINTIIWSSDCDLKQLVQLNGMAFTAWYNDKVGLVLPEATKEPDDIMDMFMAPSHRSGELEALERRIKKHIYINPDIIAMEKIIQGDAGDNIKSVARILKNGRTYKVGPKDYAKVMEALGEPNNINEFISEFEKVSKTIPAIIKKFNGYNTKKIMEMLDYNLKLVWLNEKVIPETVITKMAESEYKRANVSEIKNNFRVLCEVPEDISMVEDDLPF